MADAINAAGNTKAAENVQSATASFAKNMRHERPQEYARTTESLLPVNQVHSVQNVLSKAE